MIYRIKRKIKSLFFKSGYFQNLSDDAYFLTERITNHAIPTYINFSYDKLKHSTLSFVNSMQSGTSGFEFKYSKNCTSPNIYSSVYACLIFSMFGKLDDLSIDEKQEWVDYFNSFQSKTDGLFYDESLKNDLYNNTDWWGARHLVLHIISVYIALGSKPRYPFHFLRVYYDRDYLKTWLDKQNWLESFSHENDIDNKIMNIVTALQYQRDYWNDKQAGYSVSFIQEYLLERVNPNTGMWGYYNIEDKDELSRKIQFAYHLFPLFFYDNIDISNKEKIIDLTLATQNAYGGFGVKINSSACEDIDSIDILIRFSKLTTYKSKEIEIALRRAYIWVMANQNDDGGYVFRRNEPFFYGHDQMFSGKNESAMFSTWFRTLTIGYLSNHLFKSQFKLFKSPGFLD